MSEELENLGTRPTPPGTSGGQEAILPTPTPFVLSRGSNETFAEAEDGVVDIRPGTVLGKQFVVEREIGRGGMGVVYQAMDRLAKDRLALKVIRPAFLRQEEAIERFVREVNITRRLRHPGIVAVYDVRQDGPMLFYTMELVKGRTLRSILEAHGRLSLGKATGVIHRLCRALEHAHKLTVHRDISPENVIVQQDATVRLLDFGIAKAFDMASLSSENAPLGKSVYTAPEQLNSPGSVDARTDVFSLGVLYFEMLTCQAPSGYNRLSEMCPGLPAECDAVVRRALSPQAERYPDARTFRKAIEACHEIHRRRSGARGTNETPPGGWQ